MKLLWKLLRQHISPSQLCGFLLANIIGTVIVLAGYQFYRDVLPIFTSADSFMRTDFVIVGKRISATGSAPTFTPEDIDEISRQPFCRSLGAFVPTEYPATVTLSIAGTTLPGTEMTFESVPDHFAGVPAEEWHYAPGDSIVPVVIPRAWLSLYNFGFARSRSLPAIGDGLAAAIRLNISVMGGRGRYSGRVVALSSRAGTILVPQAFTDHTNNLYAPDRHSRPARLIIEPASSADTRLAQWIETHHLETDEDRLEGSKTVRLFNLLTTIVVAVGMVIVLLSISTLLLSIHLLIQRNREKTQTLRLIGYSPKVIARPYNLLAATLCLASLAVAMACVVLVRPLYMKPLYALYPQLPDGTVLHSCVFAVVLGIVLIVSAIAIIRRKLSVEN